MASDMMAFAQEGSIHGTWNHRAIQGWILYPSFFNLVLMLTLKVQYAGQDGRDIRRRARQ